MFRRSAIVLSRRIASPSPIRKVALRTLSTSIARHEAHPKSKTEVKELESKMVEFDDVRTYDDLLPLGAEPGTVPSDEEQSTGLERFEILGKIEGIDVFDMKPLDASRKGTLDNPIVVNSAGDEQQAGCTGYPADSHVVKWLGMSRERPVERCPECGGVYRMEYIGPPDDGHDHHGYVEPKTFADFVREEYRGTPQKQYGQ